jgi:UDP-2,3-diacylglucosamine pyrophosphatase LpxH
MDVEAFLKHIECDQLYLVGDILDAWVGSRTVRKKPAHANVLMALLRKASDRCTLRYCPGNHDAFMRRFNTIQFGSAKVEHEFVHETISGQKYLVVHGDLFDKFVTKYKPIAWFLAWLHERALRLNDAWNRAGLPPTDFARALKRRVKAMTERATQFDVQLLAEARTRGFAGVICGHIHKPAHRVDEHGISYLNVGDWVEHCTYLVEHVDGTLELLTWTAGSPTNRSAILSE